MCPVSAPYIPQHAQIVCQISTPGTCINYNDWRNAESVYIYIYTYTLALFFSFWCSLPLNLTCLFLAVAQFSTFLGDCASIMFKLHTQTHTHTHESLWYCDLMILWDFETVMLGFYEPMILWYSDTVVLFFLLSIFLYETTRRPQDERTAGTDEPKA